MRLVIAQGGAFYGCAIFTTAASFSVIEEIMKKEGFEDIMNNNGGSGGVAHLTGAYSRDTHILVEELGDRHIFAPEPIGIFDTGHLNEDLEALMKIRSSIGK